MAVTRARAKRAYKSKVKNDSDIDDNIGSEEVEQTSKKKSTITSKVRKQRVKKLISATKSAVASVTTTTTKDGKKLTAYKLAQLKKRQAMIDTANSVKPNFYPDYESKDKVDDEELSLSVKLDPENKMMISSVTNYDPIRTAILEGPSKDRLKELKRIVNQPKVLNQLRLPSVKSDVTLKAALETIKQEFHTDTDIQSGNNRVLIENEMDLRKLSIQPFDRELYLTYLRYKQRSSHIRTNSTGSCNPRDPNPLAKEIDSSIIPNFYIDLNKLHHLKFINISKESEEFELYNMLDELKKHPHDYVDVDEGYAFDGLDVSDFTTTKDFRGLELI